MGDVQPDLIGRKHIYRTILILGLLGYCWVAYSFVSEGHGIWKGCLIRQFLHIPCPSCGSTRSLIQVLHGDVAGAFMLNPIGIILFLVLLILPPWVVVDLMRGSSSMYYCYRAFEKFIVRPLPAIIAVLLLLGNWIWNFHKFM